LVRVGVHVSIGGSIAKSFDRASDRNCDTFQIFTRNPRQWRFKPIPEEEVSSFREKSVKTGISPVIAHMPYLPNLASPHKTIHTKSLIALKSELERCGQLGIPYLVTHLGSHVGKGRDHGLSKILEAMNIALSKVNNRVMLLLENEAGSRNSMGSRFEEIQSIVDGLDDYRDRLGVCFDTCHAFAAGYDLRNEYAVENAMDELDEVIGFEKVKVVHANDSKGDLNSKMDRHEHIGLGRIGEEGFKVLLHHKKLRDLPFIMETPMNETRDDYGNIRKLRELARSD
jgi:deoxyribonuclease-4